MKDPVVIIGIGEMGAVFARGLLRSGHPVYPILRGDDLRAAERDCPHPPLVLVAVAEDDLHPVLEALPAAWRGRVALLQNELLPRDWRRHAIASPTVIAVWFEKKRGQDSKVILPSPVYGPGAAWLHQALGAISIDSRLLPDEDALLWELIRKNLYILTVNIAGLVCGGSVAGLWQKHRPLALEVAGDVLDIQEWLTGKRYDRNTLIKGMAEAIDGDPDHQCTGRSAPKRLARALAHADEAGLAVPMLREIARR